MLLQGPTLIGVRHPRPPSFTTSDPARPNAN